MYNNNNNNNNKILIIQREKPVIPSMCLLAENVHTMKITMLEKVTVLNGIPNRRGRPSVKTSVLHNTKPKHWYI